MDYIKIGLLAIGVFNFVFALYYHLIEGDKKEAMHHEVSAILMFTFLNLLK